MSSLNRIILLGTVTNEPESRVTNAGDSFVKFQVEVRRPERSDGMPSQSDFIEVVAWRQVAEKAQSVQKGSSVLLEGRIITRTTEDETGKRKYFTEVDAKEIQLVDGGSMPSASPAPMAQAESPVPAFTEMTGATLEAKPVEEVKESDFDFSDAGAPAPAAAPEASAPAPTQAEAVLETADAPLNMDNDLEEEVPF